jgi:hypothetical protein
MAPDETRRPNLPQISWWGSPARQAIEIRYEVGFLGGWDIVFRLAPILKNRFSFGANFEKLVFRLAPILENAFCVRRQFPKQHFG